MEIRHTLHLIEEDVPEQPALDEDGDEIVPWLEGLVDSLYPWLAIWT
jgi:hypothetical protein